MVGYNLPDKSDIGIRYSSRIRIFRHIKWFFASLLCFILREIFYVDRAS
jgi:hypothetical protein